MARTAGRKGRVWRRNKAQALADAGYVCWICGHGGARYADHKIPLAQWRAMGGDPNDPANLAPAHGALNRCQVCGRCCNESKGNRPYKPSSRGSRDW
ncbi:MAG: HNH endonuclease [Microbispora sp.]|nr:HNH endonuclease [Microbispora sp.]